MFSVLILFLSEYFLIFIFNVFIELLYYSYILYYLRIYPVMKSYEIIENDLSSQSVGVVF